MLNFLGEKPLLDCGDDFRDWHANLLWIERRKFIIFCSSSTLFCCLAGPVRKSELQSLEYVFLLALDRAMRFEGFSDLDISYCHSIYESMSIARTNSRSVLGTMTDYVFHLKYLIDVHGGLATCNLDQVVHQLNYMPQVKRDFFNALQAFQRSLIRGVA